MKTTCVEKINMEAMKTILANFDALWENGKISHKDQYYRVIDEKEKVRTIMLKFYNQHDKDTGEALVSYKASKINPDGRLYAPYSLQTICRPVRHTVSTDLVDIDIQNCHPTLLHGIFEKNSIECPNLTSYIKERDAVFQAFSDMKRDDLKQKILAILNGHNVDEDDDPWFHTLHYEMKRLAKRVPILFPEMYKRARNSGQDNIHFRALNYELCRLERQKLDQMVSYCKKQKLVVAAYCHDGLMLYKDTTRNYQAVCDELTELCRMKVVIKEFDEAIDLTQLPEREIPDVELMDDDDFDTCPVDFPSYKELKKKKEETFFKTLYPLRFVEERKGKLYTSKQKEFTEKYMNEYCMIMTKDGLKSASFPQQWLADPHIRTYHHYEFDPSMTCGDDVYNEFKGFNADLLGGDASLGQEGLQHWLDLCSLIVNHDPKALDYLHKTNAWRFQKPKQKLGVAIVFVSKQGSGKGTYGEYLALGLIGKEYSVETSSIRDVITDGFNAAGAQKLLVLFDESSVDESDNDKLKNIITSCVQTVRKKYVDTETNVESYTNFIFMSNTKAPVMITEGERRHVVFRGDESYNTKDERRSRDEKDAYWTTKHKFLNPLRPCPHTAKAIIEYYRGIDLTGFNPQLDRILTAEYNHMKAFSMPAELKFLRDYSDDVSSRLITQKDREKHIIYLRAKELYETYVEWNKNYNPRGKAVGKNTMVDRWADVPFVKRTRCGKEGNVAYLSWSLRDIDQYWEVNGYIEKDIESVDDHHHARLLASQVR